MKTGRLEEDRDRLVRLRERQLQARNPRHAEERLMHTVARRRGRRQKPVTLAEMVRDIPHKWRGVILGALIGLGITVVLPMLWDSTWAEIVGLVAMLILAVLGLFYGQALDLRDDLRDFSRRK